MSYQVELLPSASMCLHLAMIDITLNRMGMSIHSLTHGKHAQLPAKLMLPSSGL
jgi:hypothetical protein